MPEQFLFLNMNNILENHRKLLERKKQYKDFGYDIDLERDFVIKNGEPFFGKILEVGTGKGYFTLALAQKGYNITTIDISEKEQEFAKLNIKYHKMEDKVTFGTDNAEKLSFKNNSFDVVLSVNTIHHLENPFLAVDEFIRVVSLEGKVIVSDLSEEGFKMMEKLHQSEGGTHNRNKVMLSDIERHIIDRRFKVKKARSKYQEVLNISFCNYFVHLPYDYFYC